MKRSVTLSGGGVHMRIDFEHAGRRAKVTCWGDDGKSDDDSLLSESLSHLISRACSGIISMICSDNSEVLPVHTNGPKAEA